MDTKKNICRPSRIYHQNIQCISNKSTELDIALSNNNNCCDFVLLSEQWQQFQQLQVILFVVNRAPSGDFNQSLFNLNNLLDINFIPNHYVIIGDDYDYKNLFKFWNQ